MLQVFLPHVEQRLAGHGRVLLALLFRHEVEHGFHQRAFAGRGRRLHHDGQRLIEQPRDRAQIGHLLVGLLAHHAAAHEVFEDAVEEPRLLQQRHGSFALLGRHQRLFLGLGQRLANLLALQVGQHGPELAHFAMDRFFLGGEFVRGLLDEHRALPEGFHVQRVAVTAGFAAHVPPRHLHVHPHLAPAGAFLQPQHAIRARPDGGDDLARFDFHLRRGWRGQWHRALWRGFLARGAVRMSG